ncbi:family 16 glycoside hydrolase [Jiulongibacter sediminis]|uniref:family 16 glycoside hydrolase n=1 Tax=Jiulongibacter sediminis TaxID=1605367 RepID=UPI0009E66C2A|nr:family 16 glycoside hydrolase [Jiulongibacter sediminis]
MNLNLKSLLLAFLPVATLAQTQILAENLNHFKNPAGNWSIVGEASANPFVDNDLKSTPGTGVLVNIHEHGTYGGDYELVSDFTHGDADIEFDFMMAKGSNSGVYLQGNYEIQLLDSWGKKTAKYGDCGGIYERWDESQPDGMKGYEGSAPRVNACKAPGLWQHMKISFQAPRFDEKGQKTENAKILSVTLNGQLLHENVELSGVTRGALTEKEVAQGPLRFQGDHGSLAFRNIVLTSFDQPAAELQNLSYEVNYDPYNPEANPKDLPVQDKGELNELTWEFLKQPNEYVYTISGDFIAPNDGKYTFTQYSSSNNSLKIDGEMVIENRYTGANDGRSASIELKAGKHTLEFYNAKYDGWMRPALGLFVSGPGFREKALNSPSSMLGNKPADPILILKDDYDNLRSFMDFTEDGERKRVTHAISVSTPAGIHFTYDLDKGALLQAWRGQFLNATPMWDSRGDGSSRPLGAITPFNDDLTISDKLPAIWPSDTAGSGYRPLGYSLDDENIPTFRYQIYGNKVSDRIEVAEKQKLKRSISVDSNAPFAARLAEGYSIEKIEEGLYAINDKSWFVEIPDAEGITQRSSDGKSELIVIAKGKLTYNILF